MTNSESMAAELLAVSSSALAAMATNRLMEKLPSIQQQFGDTAFHDWKDHFQQRILELSAALAENEPKLFASRINWANGAFQAREVSQDLLRESLICLREILDEELPESNRKAPHRFINDSLDSLSTANHASHTVDTADSNAKLAMQYLFKVLDGNSREAIRLVVDAVNEGLPVADAYEHVLLAAQREIGIMWHQAEVSVAEEHFVTSTTTRAMSILGFHAETSPPNGLTVVSAAVAKNPHEIGVRAVSDLFELAGWRTVCLGGDTPASEVAEAVRCFNANLVLISAALSTQIKTARKTIQMIRDLNTNCQIMVGGMAFIDTPELWRQIGADGYASTLNRALELGTQLVKSPGA